MQSLYISDNICGKVCMNGRYFKGKSLQGKLKHTDFQLKIFHLYNKHNL
jgi:hypothetical protein